MKPGICITLAVVLAFAVSCAGPRAFTKGRYEDPNAVALLDDRFSENDMHSSRRNDPVHGRANISGRNGTPVS